jgi:hypothetical protein
MSRDRHRRSHVKTIRLSPADVELLAQALAAQGAQFSAWSRQILIREAQAALAKTPASVSQQGF